MAREAAARTTEGPTPDCLKGVVAIGASGDGGGTGPTEIVTSRKGKGKHRWGRRRWKNRRANTRSAEDGGNDMCPGCTPRDERV